MNLIKKEIEDYKILLRNVPAMVFAMFVLSVVSMNLLANKELYASTYFCIDCGQMISWIPFLCMDCICKRFGAKASAKISVLVMIINLAVVLVFKVLCMTPGHWGAYFDAPDAVIGEFVNEGLNSTMGGTWYVVVGSAIAMFVSAIVNAVINEIIGKKTDKGNFTGFALRSYVSTGIGQLVDNLIFTTLVSHVFFGWNWMQVVICSVVSMFLELGLEALFSPVGYRVSKKWEKFGVGREYLGYISGSTTS